MLAQGGAVQILPQAQGEGMTSDFPSVNGLKMQKKYGGGTSLVVPWLRLRAPSAGGLGLIPGQGTRSHMLQLRVPCAATKRSKIWHAATKTWCGQINKFFFL